MSSTMKTGNALHGKKTVAQAVRDSFVKLNPKTQIKNLATFLVFVSTILTTVLFLAFLAGIRDAGSGYILGVTMILRFICPFASFAEAIVGGRGKAQADFLRAAKQDMEVHRIPSAKQKDEVINITSVSLVKGNLVIVKTGEVTPGDDEVIEEAASVDESAITGESTPIIRGAGGDRSAVTGGTKVLSDQIVVRITSEPEKNFLDKMIAMVEGAARKKTSNEITLGIFLVTLSTISILVIMALYGYSASSAGQLGMANPASITSLVALLVCPAPTTIGALLSAIGTAGTSRLNEADILAINGRAAKAAGNVDTLLLDRIRAITLGSRRACEFIPVDGHEVKELADATQLASLPDETPEGRNMVILIKETFGTRERESAKEHMAFIPFTARTRMSGVDTAIITIRKGVTEVTEDYVQAQDGIYSRECEAVVKRVSEKGDTPLVVAQNHTVLGIIYLKDIIKSGVKEKFANLRKMGIKTVMVTDDNPLTVAAITTGAGVGDFLAGATPEGKSNTIRDLQSKDHVVAMTGGGTNDAPVLAQMDVAVAVNAGAQAAKEADNTADLDSSPTKLTGIVGIGKQLSIARDGLTTFSVTNGAAKYSAIISALFMGLCPGFTTLDTMHLHSVQSTILPAVIYSAPVIVVLIPLALQEVEYREVSVGQLPPRSLLVYGVGGIMAPFLFIKPIDMIFATTGLF